MKRALFLTVAALLFAGATAAHAQNTACYDWDCEDSAQGQGDCTFDASCSEITDGQIWKYSWDFGDGSGTLTGNPVTFHHYDTENYATVRLKVALWGDGESPQVECEINIFNNHSFPLATEGRCEE